MLWRHSVLIPNHTHDGVLPPFIPGATPTDNGAVAPYRTKLADFAERFAGTTERKVILSGLLAYRTALRSVGINSGFQWLDGSFVEDCETIRGRPPKDIDLITFSFRPKACAETDAWRKLILSRPDLFDPETTKSIYKCDAYFVDLGVHPFHVVAQTRYWFGLFSHQRDTYLWKGMIEVPFTEHDNDVESFLIRGAKDAS
jgi:hypothetical protein